MMGMTEIVSQLHRNKQLLHRTTNTQAVTVSLRILPHYEVKVKLPCDYF